MKARCKNLELTVTFRTPAFPLRAENVETDIFLDDDES
jgi:hypothetical protein